MYSTGILLLESSGADPDQLFEMLDVKDFILIALNFLIIKRRRSLIFRKIYLKNLI